MSQEEAGPSEERPIEVPLMPTQRKIQVIAKAIDLGTPEHNVVIKDLDQVTFDFSVVPMYLLHTIQKAVVEEMMTRKCEMFVQLKHSKTTISSLKNKVKDTD